MCRYGAACLVRDNAAEIAKQAAQLGTLGGLDIDTVHRAADEEAAMLAELLPIGAPDDFYLVTSPPLLREVRRTLAYRLGQSPEEAARGAQLLALITTFPVPDFDPELIDRLSRDREDDMIVHTAFEGRADFIITTDDDLLVSGEGTEYTRLDGRSARAHSLMGFSEMIETSTFGLEQVPEILEVRVIDRQRLPLEVESEPD